VRIERLDEHHDVEDFTCGEKALDLWLRGHALANQVRDLSRTYVLIDDADRIVGHYSLTMGGVVPSDLPRRYGRGLPAIEIGMALIGRFAIATAAQGRGLGRDLLIDAIRVAATAGELVAARFIAVDPLNAQARAFYTAFGFRDIPTDPQDRMYIRLDEVADAVGLH
jgi:GNAT superfamily N-acetyltransferase